MTSQEPSRALSEVGHPVLAHDFRAADLRRLGVRLRHAVGIDMPLDRVVERTDEVLLVQERKQLRGLIDRDQLELHAEVAAARLGHLQPVQARPRAGEHDAAGDMHAAGLTGDALELLVEVDRVLLQLRDVRVTVDGVHAAGGMPGGAAGELAALEQQHVLPARLGQVIQHARADHAATDHHHPGIALHVCSGVTRWTRPAAPAAAAPGRACRSARSATSGTARWPCRRAPPGGSSGSSRSRHRASPQRASPGARC